MNEGRSKAARLVCTGILLPATFLVLGTQLAWSQQVPEEQPIPVFEFIPRTPTAPLTTEPTAVTEPVEPEAELTSATVTPQPTPPQKQTISTLEPPETSNKTASLIPSGDPESLLAARRDKVRRVRGILPLEEELEPEPVIPEGVLRNLKVPDPVARRSKVILEEAKRLADRGALHSARQDFLQVLRLVAQSLDAQLGQRYHSLALTRGLQALDEADDFVMRSYAAEADLDVAAFVASHNTPVLKASPSGYMTPLVAMQQYYQYAHEQLVRAGNGAPIASEALYALGRVETLLKDQRLGKEDQGPKAIAYHQAALTTNRANTSAANELGVLLAQSGQLKQAQRILTQATSVSADPTAASNLAEVRRRMAIENVKNRRIATPALQTTPVPQLAQSSPTQAQTRRPQIQWVDPRMFNTVGSGLEVVAAAPQFATPQFVAPQVSGPGSAAPGYYQMQAVPYPGQPVAVPYGVPGVQPQKPATASRGPLDWLFKR